jgi:hypothetical protein
VATAVSRVVTFDEALNAPSSTAATRGPVSEREVAAPSPSQATVIAERAITESEESVRNTRDHGTCKFLFALLKPLNKKREFFYLKHDGSLANGIELVTHPATLEAHRTIFPWQQIEEFYHKNNITADDTDSCGLHIHMNKSLLEEGHRIRLGYFFNSQREYMQILARRNSNEYARFKPDNTAIENMAMSGGKYEALNWTPKHTVEFRLFKGTVKHDVVLASIELVNSATQFTKDRTIESLKNNKKKAWKDFLAAIALDKTLQYLPNYMKSQGVL